MNKYLLKKIILTAIPLLILILGVLSLNRGINKVSKQQDDINSRIDFLNSFYNQNFIKIAGYNAVFDDSTISENNNSVVIMFIPECTDAIKYEWKFGDDKSSFETRPVHTFDISERSWYNIELYTSFKDNTLHEVRKFDFSKKTEQEISTNYSKSYILDDDDNVTAFFQPQNVNKDNKYQWFVNGKLFSSNKNLKLTFPKNENREVKLVINGNEKNSFKEIISGDKIINTSEGVKKINIDNLRLIANQQTNKETGTFKAKSFIKISDNKTAFCNKDKKKYEITVSPDKGILKIDNILKNRENGKYYFTPADYNKNIKITYLTSTDTSKLSVNIYNLRADFDSSVVFTNDNLILTCSVKNINNKFSYLWKIKEGQSVLYTSTGSSIKETIPRSVDKNRTINIELKISFNEFSDIVNKTVIIKKKLIIISPVNPQRLREIH